MADSTESRTRPNAMRRSTPGVAMCSSRAVVKGLLLLSPSSATDPAFAANAISVSETVGSILARPRPTYRDATVRFMVLAKGLSRHASRMISRSCFAGSTANNARSSPTVSSRTSLSVSSAASIGIR